MIKNRNIINKIIYLLMIIFIFLNMVGISNGISNKEENKKIHKNIVIENIHVGKLTKQSAINKLKNNYPIKNFNIIYNSKKWTINVEDIDLNYHIDESVQEAFDYTRSDKIWNNLKRKGKLNINKTYNIKLKATYDEAKLVEDTITCVVQVNGKVRGKFEAAVGSSNEELEKQAMELETVQRQIEGKTIRKVIVVKGKVVNIVAN